MDSITEKFTTTQIFLDVLTDILSGCVEHKTDTCDLHLAIAGVPCTITISFDFNNEIDNE